MTQNLKTHLKQLSELMSKVDSETGSYKVYDFLSSITQIERDELWELCNNLRHILLPINLLQKQIEAIEEPLNTLEEKEEDFLPSGAEIVKGEACIMFAPKINQLL